MYCKDCKYWSRFTNPEDVDYHGKYAGHCSSSKFVYGDSNVPADSLAYCDYEGCAADFATGENFGCIYWELKS